MALELDGSGGLLRGSFATQTVHLADISFSCGYGYISLRKYSLATPRGFCLSLSLKQKHRSGSDNAKDLAQARSFVFCPPTRARTWDLILKRDLLYQLSYGRIYLIVDFSLMRADSAGHFLRSQLSYGRIYFSRTSVVIVPY